MTYFVDAWNLFSLVAILSIGPETKNNLNNLRTDLRKSETVGRFDAMSGSEDFSVPDLASADHKIQNDRQRKQIRRFGKVRYHFF